MSVLATAIDNSLSADVAVRQSAERQIQDMQGQAGFGQQSLNIGRDPSSTDAIRLGSILALKNWIKINWTTDEALHLISDVDRQQIKSEIVPALVLLCDRPALQVQLAEIVSLIAETDFPGLWPDLFDQLVFSLQPLDFKINNAILGTVHSICGRWRSLFRSDDLFREIKFVLGSFAAPFLELFQQVDRLLSDSHVSHSAPNMALLLETMYLLVEVYHDLNSQDLPEFFEDNNNIFMPILLKQLAANHLAASESQAIDDGADESVQEKIKAAICETAELYAKQYVEDFADLDRFVEAVWVLLQSLGSSRRFDALVSRAISFLSAVVRMPGKASLFETETVLQNLCQNIVLPNLALREFEEEYFEDDPSEYIRRDIESTVESGTRRHAASDFVKALLEHFEMMVTKITEGYIQAYLQHYHNNQAMNWKAKDTAIFLLTSVASRGMSTAAQGVTSTNSLVDLIDFFAQHIMPDLRAPPNELHPIIRADAIRFLHTFRSQLTKDQLMTVLPMLVPHLKDASQVVYIYAAMTIERILFIKRDGQSIFTPPEILPYINEIFTSAFTIIKASPTSQQMASNDQLMKCIMRTLLAARSQVAPFYELILKHLCQIIAKFSQNPSNPKFNHYTFECLSALIRFVVPQQTDALRTFEESLFPPFQYILVNDVVELAPFCFQVLSQMVELHPAVVPEAYKSLIPGLLMAPLWTSRGNVPALVRLVRAFLVKNAFGDPQLAQLRDVLRYLLPQKIHDASSFELSESLVEHVTSNALQPILTDIILLMLTRLTTSRNTTFVQSYIHFICLLFALRKDGLPADSIVGIFDRIQAGCFSPMLASVLPEVQKTPQRQRKLVALGLSRLLTDSSLLVTSNPQTWIAAMTALLRLLLLPQQVRKTDLNGETEADEVVVLDLEAVGYQASFSRLGASELRPHDPIMEDSDPQHLLIEDLCAADRVKPGVYSQMMQLVPSDLAGHLFEVMRIAPRHRALLAEEASLCESGSSDPANAENLAGLAHLRSQEQDLIKSLAGLKRTSSRHWEDLREIHKQNKLTRLLMRVKGRTKLDARIAHTQRGFAIAHQAENEAEQSLRVLQGIIGDAQTNIEQAGARERRRRAIHASLEQLYITIFEQDDAIEGTEEHAARSRCTEAKVAAERSRVDSLRHVAVASYLDRAKKALDLSQERINTSLTCLDTSRGLGGPTLSNDNARFWLIEAQDACLQAAQLFQKAREGTESITPYSRDLARLFEGALRGQLSDIALRREIRAGMITVHYALSHCLLQQQKQTSRLRAARAEAASNATKYEAAKDVLFHTRRRIVLDITTSGCSEADRRELLPEYEANSPPRY